MTAPETLIYGSLLVYTADAGTARPTYVSDAVDTEDWTLLGSAGYGDQAPGGVKIGHPITTTLWRGEGSVPRAVALTEEDVTIEVAIAEFNAANYAMSLGDKTVTAISQDTGVPGSNNFDLYRGAAKLGPVAILCRGASPELAGGTLEYYVPYAVQNTNVEPQFQKSDPALISFVFQALEDPTTPGTDRIGQLRIQTAVPGE